MAQIPGYNLIPVDIIIREVLNLENLKLGMIHNVIQQDKIEYFVTTVHINENYSNYMALISRKITPEYPEPLVFFITVQYSSEGVLVANSINVNAIQVPLTNVRSRMDINFRSMYYGLSFNVPQLDRYREIKQAISNLFVFPNLTFVLFGELVVSFVFVKEFFTVSYIGKLRPENMMVEPLIHWDWADGTLLATFDNQLVYAWNKNYFAMSNMFPELTYEEQYNVKVILGGASDYMISDQKVVYPDQVNNDIIVRATIASRFNYNVTQLIGGGMDFTTLSSFIPIPDTNLYITAFSNVQGTSIYPSYALLLQSDPTNANYPFTTFEVNVIKSNEKTADYYTVGTLSFSYDDSGELLVYVPGFEDYLVENKGNIILSDINPYYLFDNGPHFDPIQNNFLSAKEEEEQQQQQQMQRQQQQMMQRQQQQQMQRQQKQDMQQQMQQQQMQRQQKQDMQQQKQQQMQQQKQQKQLLGTYSRIR